MHSVALKHYDKISVAKSSKVEFISVDKTRDPTDFVRYLDRVRRTDLFR